MARPVSLLDLLPTLVELGGGAPPDGDGASLVPALGGAEPPERDVPLEYLAEGVRAPQVTLVRGPLKLVRSLGEPDLLYDLAADPGERVDVADDPRYADELRSLAGAADERWDLGRLDTAVRASQERRRVVVSALTTGALTAWDHPARPAAPTSARATTSGRRWRRPASRSALPVSHIRGQVLQCNNMRDCKT